jgi:hypothetical protein
MFTRGGWAGVLAGAALLGPAVAGERPTTDITPEGVAALVRRAKPDGPEAWMRIPWAGSLAQARAAGRKEGCPVFLFALRGELAGNRC